MAFELAEEKIRRLALRWPSGSVLAVQRKIGKGGEMVSDWKMDNELTMIGVNWPLNWRNRRYTDWHCIGRVALYWRFGVGMARVAKWCQTGKWTMN